MERKKETTKTKTKTKKNCKTAGRNADPPHAALLKTKKK
jgi:hypothetical protein